MIRRLPPLNSLKAFEAAARLGSFNRAATELRVSHGAISRHIQVLEDWLGRPMFQRLNRRVVLTEAGQAYQTEVGAALDRIAAATSAHLGRGHTRELRVNATPTLTLRWLIPRLSSFHIDHPGIEVRLATSNQPIPEVRSTADVIIRRGSDDVPGYRGVWLMPDHRVIVCSPGLLARMPLKALSDIQRHTLLYSASRPFVWPNWFKAMGLRNVKPRRTLVLEHSYQAIEGAVNGLGLAIGSLPLIADDVAAQRLVMPFPDKCMPMEGYCAYVESGRLDDPAISAFCCWLDRLAPTATLSRQDARVMPPTASSS